MAKHLLVTVTGHGFGHAAQTAPVIEALRALRPDLRVSVRSDLPPAIVAQFFPGAEPAGPAIADFGLAMRSAIDVDVDAAERAFGALHQRFAVVVAAEAAAIGRLRPDLVLANVGFVPIAGAARAGIPVLGFCSLNWLDMVRAYCAGWRDADAILADMATSYRLARAFIRPAPSMAMKAFDTIEVGPVACAGRVRRAELAARLQLRAGERVVLVSLGGFDPGLAFATWPAVPGVRYVVAGLAPPARPDMTALDLIGISHLDCLASCDAVITKPGYGTVVEAVCHGIPIVYVRRRVWPEEPAVVGWLEAHGTAREVARDALERGDLEPILAALWAMPRKSAVPATGNRETAELVAAAL